ncbi:MAG: glycosyltransferase family 4 protein [Bacillota bacterium]
MNLALVHEWLVNIGGSEKCVQSFINAFPGSHLYTIVHDPGVAAGMGLSGRVTSTFIQRLPRATRWYQKYLPLMPLAVEQLDLGGYDVILSSSHAFAKGVLTRADQMHVCYCHTPVRYVWDLYHHYLSQWGLHRGPFSWPARALLHYLRLYDVSSANRVDHFIANSGYVARRIWRAYRREATVIYPPVEVDLFQPGAKKDGYFMVLSRLVPYKKVDVIVEAFARNGLPLVVIGDGPDMEKIKRLASKNIEIAGWLPSEEVAGYMARARALVFAADEDFGIVPVEAQACGTPVIAYGRGGVMETVNPLNPPGGTGWFREGYTPTGVFFENQTPESINRAVAQFIKHEDRFDPSALRRHSLRFGRRRFEEEIKAFIENRWREFRGEPAPWEGVKTAYGYC